MRTAFINELTALAEHDERIILLTGDLGYSVVEQFVEKFPKRFINVGIAEQNMIGIAAGLALSGKILFVYSIANFPTIRCLEQIRNDVCYHNANVKIVSVGAGFAYGTQGYTHFGIEDIAIMRALPRMNVFSPSDPIETKALTDYAAKTEGPTYLRLGKAKEKILHTKPYVASSYKIPPIQSIINNNSHKAILSVGAITAAVADFVKDNQLNYNIWSVPSVKPLDEVTLIHIAKKSSCIYTIEEHMLSGGFGSAILEAYEKLFTTGQIDFFPKVIRLGIPDKIPNYIGTQDFMRQIINMDALKTYTYSKEHEEINIT